MHSSLKLSFYCLLSGLVSSSLAQTTVSSSYTQNFDSLSQTGNSNAWSQDSTLSEWWAYRLPANTGVWTDVSTYFANSGNTANGSLYSFGSGSDRALGSIGSGNDASGGYRYGTGFTNGFSSHITGISLAFRAETWRVGTLNNQNSVDFQYSLDANGVNDPSGTWIDFDALDFRQAVNTSSGPVDGNTNYLEVAGTIENLNIGLDQTVWIRWTDIDHIGADHGLAIDDLQVSFATVPEPASIFPLGIGALAFFRRRKN